MVTMSTSAWRASNYPAACSVDIWRIVQPELGGHPITRQPAESDGLHIAQLELGRPSSSHSSTFGNRFNKRLEGGQLPRSLQILMFGYAFSRGRDIQILPAGFAKQCLAWHMHVSCNVRLVQTPSRRMKRCMCTYIYTYVCMHACICIRICICISICICICICICLKSRLFA